MDLRSEVVPWKLAVAALSLVAMVMLVDRTTPVAVLVLYGVLAIALVATALHRIRNRHVLLGVSGFAVVFGLYSLAASLTTPIVAIGYLVAGGVAAAIGYSYPFHGADAPA